MRDAQVPVPVYGARAEHVAARARVRAFARACVRVRAQYARVCVRVHARASTEAQSTADLRVALSVGGSCMCKLCMHQAGPMHCDISGR